MAELTGHADLYAAGRRIRDRVLEGTGSLFRDDAQLWTSEVLDQIQEVVLSPDESEGPKFLPKLQKQLAGKTAQVIQLAAETLFVVLLIEHSSSTTSEEKRRQLEKVLSWQPE